MRIHPKVVQRVKHIAGQIAIGSPEAKETGKQLLRLGIRAGKGPRFVVASLLHICLERGVFSRGSVLPSRAVEVGIEVGAVKLPNIGKKRAPSAPVIKAGIAKKAAQSMALAAAKKQQQSAPTVKLSPTVMKKAVQAMTSAPGPSSYFRPKATIINAFGRSMDEDDLPALPSGTPVPQSIAPMGTSSSAPDLPGEGDEEEGEDFVEEYDDEEEEYEEEDEYEDEDSFEGEEEVDNPWGEYEDEEMSVSGDYADEDSLDDSEVEDPWGYWEDDEDLNVGRYVGANLEGGRYIGRAIMQQKARLRSALALARAIHRRQRLEAALVLARTVVPKSQAQLIALFRALRAKHGIHPEM